MEDTNGSVSLLWDAYELKTCITQYLEHVLHEV